MAQLRIEVLPNDLLYLTNWVITHVDNPSIQHRILLDRPKKSNSYMLAYYVCPHCKKVMLNNRNLCMKCIILN